MQLYVRNLIREVMTLDVESNTTILEVKVLVFRKSDGRIQPKLVIFAGKALENDRTMDDYGMSDQCNVYVLVESDLYILRQHVYGK
mmetsp:Transcript_36624/g.41709  ORF Transcript_36624/g.41709 Transcript_36624/m.41709 type:complete len:86 (+) Transcript_36624:117-374(+)